MVINSDHFIVHICLSDRCNNYQIWQLFVHMVIFQNFTATRRRHVLYDLNITLLFLNGNIIILLEVFHKCIVINTDKFYTYATFLIFHIWFFMQAALKTNFLFLNICSHLSFSTFWHLMITGTAYGPYCLFNPILKCYVCCGNSLFFVLSCFTTLSVCEPGSSSFLPFLNVNLHRCLCFSRQANVHQLSKKKFKQAKWQHKNVTKTWIIQWFRTDLGRSVGVTTASQMVC